MSDEIQDPMGALAEAAVSHHEMYVSWIAAGFTQEQAFELLMCVVSNMVGGD